MRGASYKKGEIIFREGDPGNCMYDIFWGRVGVYTGYGTPQEKKLAELKTEDFFGEMGLLDRAPRSATVVSLSDDTYLGVITESDFHEYFQEMGAGISKLNTHISETIGGIRTIKAFAAEESRAKVFDGTAGDVADLRVVLNSRFLAFSGATPR